MFQVDLKIINISKSLKSIYMYGCILSLNILSKLNEHKELEFLEGKSSFSRHFLVNARLHFSDPQTTPRYSLEPSTYHLDKFERKSSKYRIYMNLNNKTSKFHVFTPNTPLNSRRERECVSLKRTQQDLLC